MPRVPLRAVLVEDSAADARLLLHALDHAGFAVSATRVEREEELLAALDELPDIVLSDYHLPQFDALRALQLVREHDADAPFLIVSGTIGEEQAVLAIKQGADDYLLKDRLGRLGPAIRQALQQRALRRAECAAQRARQASEAQYRLLADSIPHLVLVAGPNGSIDFLNRPAAEYLGVTAADCGEGRWLAMIHPDDRSGAQQAVTEAQTNAASPSREIRVRRADGEFRWHLLRVQPLGDGDGHVLRWFGTCTDIHDQKVAANTVKRNEARWRQLLDQLFACVGLLSPEGNLVWANDALVQCAGEPLDQLFGRTLWTCGRWGGSEVGPRVQAAVLRAAAGEQVRFDATLQRRAGPPQIVDVQIAPLFDDAGRIVFLMPFAVDVTTRETATSELRLRDRALQAVSQGILIADATAAGMPIVYASPAFSTLTGYTEDEVRGRSCHLLQGEETDAETLAIMREALDARQPCAVELLNYRKDGTPFWNALSLNPIRNGDHVTHYVGVQTDVTERRRLEEQVRQAQKMDAFGQLAGGIAHDFNNLLCIINAESEMLDRALEPNDPRVESVVAIQEAGRRAASLTAQLLSFSRKTIVQPRLLDLNAIVERHGKLLARVLGEDIELAIELGPELSPVRADAAQLEQVLMNLALNARDAMPTGGRLRIATRHSAAGSPERIELVVSDTGAGIPPHVRSKIFEPFFTTKSVGKGTGLGLATVYGIIASSQGTIDVESTVGRGTTFVVSLPAAVGRWITDAGPVPTPRASDVRPVALATETLLVVEDEPGVRRVLRVTLEAQGYTVLEAENGPSALALVERHRGPLHLLVTDVVMPGMGGREVAEHVLARHPAARVLYTSGYTDDAVVRNGVFEAHDAFLQKPFSRTALVDKVRALLKAGPRSSVACTPDDHDARPRPDDGRSLAHLTRT